MTNHAKAQAMYNRYLAGLSLAKVGAEFGVGRQNVYKIFWRRGLPMRSAPARSGVEFDGAKYTLRDCGYYARTTGDRDYLHRDVWRHHFGSIPEGYDVHHRDHDRLNNEPDNLECLSKDEHTRRHQMERHS